MVRESPSNPNFAGFESELFSDRRVIVFFVLRNVVKKLGRMYLIPFELAKCAQMRKNILAMKTCNKERL